MKFLCLVLLCTFSGGFSDPQKLVNIDFVGRGYDVFYGNPQSNQADPGFRDPILALTYEKVS